MKMKYSIVATFTGWLENQPTDTTLNEVIKFCKEHKIDYDLSDEGDSEYAYMAEESPGSEWEKVRDLNFSGVFNRDFLEALNDLGAYAESTGTMGTLGGPLGLGIVPDIVFDTQSQFLIASIRITPFVDREDWSVDDARWERMKAAVVATFGD